MPDDRIIALNALKDRQRMYIHEPLSFYPIFLRPCVVRILMVTDDGGGFGSIDFGLEALLDVLSVPPGPWARFDVTKAHRRNDSSADISGFRFDSHNLAQYDQVWLFGVERSGSPPLSDAELRAVAEFMDGGGGVFATGDHEDLGVGMCGQVPRVRSMRKWHWPNPGPNGEPVAPAVGGLDRYDTLSAGNDPGVQFDDQSDDVPQTITPKLYSTWSWLPWMHRSYPHPLLCGPRGVIRVLPDHPHEGECYEPADLSKSFTFSGYTITEYPGGMSPEVIAWSTIAGRSAGVKGPLNPRSFGAIGAYDGHRQGVGRVVVDATWHHFFNVNLVGELGNADPIKSVGFDATATGHTAYEDIKAYFRNIAVWLARPATQSCMWWRAVWWLRWHHVIAMDLRPAYLESTRAIDLPELIRLGGQARDVLGRTASQCTVVRWVFEWVFAELRPHIYLRLEPMFDPWRPRFEDQKQPQRIQFDVAGPAASELLIDAALGGLIYAVAREFPNATEETRERAEEVDWGAVVNEQLDHAVDLMAQHTRDIADSLAALSETLVRPDRGRDS